MKIRAVIAAGVASILVLALQAAPSLAAVDCSGFPNGTVNYDAWLDNIFAVDPNNPTTVLDLDPSITHSLLPGTVISGQLEVCSHDTGSSGSYAGIVNFQPGANMVNPNWNDHDHTPIDTANVAVLVSRWFQTVPNEIGRTFKIQPKLKRTGTTVFPTTGSTNALNIVIIGPAGGPNPPHVAGPENAPVCDVNPTPPPTAEPLFQVRTKHPTGVPNFSIVAPNIVLNSGVDVCASADVSYGNRTLYRVGVKFLPLSVGSLPPGIPAPLRIAPWEDQPFLKDELVAYHWLNSSTEWYQTTPADAGEYLLIPRVFLFEDPGTPTSPDAAVIAEGEPFVFCVEIDPCPPL